MRYLIVAHLTADSPELRSWLTRAKSSDAAFSSVLLVPAAPLTYWRTWDVRESQQAAERRAERAGEALRAAGIPVERVAVGSREPLAAIEDLLRGDPHFDAIVMATLPVGPSRWLRMDLPHQARRRTGLPVIHIATSVVDWQVAGPAEMATGDRVPADRSAAAATATATAVLPPRVQRDRAATSRIEQALAQSPALARAYDALRTEAREQAAIVPELAELIALYVARKFEFVELWQDHVGVARGLGMEDTRMTALEHWRASELVRFDDRERAVLAYTDAVCAEGAAVPDAREYLERFFEPAQIVALTLLIGCFRMTGSFAHALSLGTSEPFVGWSLFRGELDEAHL